MNKARKFEIAFFFLIGGTTYLLIELMWRGYTHWTMGIVGGFCFIVIGKIHQTLIRYPLYLQAIVATLFITSIEFFAGIIVNIYFDLAVWDYSQMPFNIMGQICLPYMMLWLPLSIGAIVMYRLIQYRLFGQSIHRLRLF